MMKAMGALATALRRPETYVGCAREAVSALRCAALYPLGLAEAALSTGRPSGDQTHDTPVLLVHGYGHNRSGWFLLDRTLRRAGFSSVHTMNYVAFGKEGVPELAARLAERVQEIRRVTGAAKVLHEHGVKEIHVAATHAVLCGPAIERLKAANLASLVVTDSIPLKPDQILPQTRVLSVDTLLGEAIKRIHRNESVSRLFR